MEEWRPTPGFEDLYEVSNTGKVRSITRVIHKSEEWMTRNHQTLHREFDSVYKSKELKPCATTKRGVKYHLHRRFKDGYYNQASYYVYAEDLVKGAFPELDEEWKAIPGYEDYYEVSNQGRVRSIDRDIPYIRNGGVVIKRCKSKILKPIMFGTKRPHVLLTKDGKHEVFRVDRLYDQVWSPKIEDTEEWRPIPGFEDLYEVSQSGRVRSLSRVVPRLRVIHGVVVKDIAVYVSRELKPHSYHTKSGSRVYHLHRRYKSGTNGQTDVHWPVEDLVRLVFPELYEKEN